MKKVLTSFIVVLMSTFTTMASAQERQSAPWTLTPAERAQISACLDSVADGELRRWEQRTGQRALRVRQGENGRPQFSTPAGLSEAMLADVQRCGRLPEQARNAAAAGNAGDAL